MSVVPDALRDANQQLVALSGRYAEGEVDRPAFRQARRQLICEVLGLEVPEVPAAHDELALPREDDTMPGGQPAAAQVSPPQDSGDDADQEAPVEAPLAESSPADVEREAGTTLQTDALKVKDATLQVTLLLLLLAFVGLGGLLWFVLR